MNYNKITDEDLAGKGNVGMPDTPMLSQTEMQEKLDELSRRVIIPHFNRLVDDLDNYMKNIYTKSETDRAINQKVVEIGAGDMQKAVYDTDNDGKVDSAKNADNSADAEKLGGHTPEYFATAEDVENIDLSGLMPKTGGAFSGSASTSINPADGTPQFRNIVVLPAGTDVNTLTVPAGTVIMVRK